MFRYLSSKKNNLIKVIALGISILLLYILTYLLNFQNSIQPYMLILVITAALCGGYQLCQRYDQELLVKYILFIGFIMRIGYMLYTPSPLRQHDLMELSIDSNGHAAYILQILDGQLPPSNEGQFYHPPLYHIVSSMVIYVLKGILRLIDSIDLINCARIISCFFSCLTLYSIEALCTKMQIKKPLPMALIAFLPNFYLMGGRVNNDAMAVYFMIMILLYSIRWYQNQSIKNTVILALSFGLGMMTKMSVALLAIPSALLMLYVLGQSIKKSSFALVVKRFCLFATISMPLGLAYPIRNMILFHQPLNYILDLSNVGFASQNYSYVDRFLSFPITNMFNPIYNDAYKDYNIWMYLLKGGLFGEFRFPISPTLPSIMLFLFLLINIIMVVFTLFSYKEKDITVHYLLMSSLVIFASYIVFNLKYPYGCTMDFRYIAPVFIINSLLLGKNLELKKDRAFIRSMYHITTGLLISFSFISILMFCIIR